MRVRSKLTILSVGSLVAVAGFALIMLSVPTGPVGLGLQSYAHGDAVVTLTNLSGSKLDYLLKVERKTNGTWPSYQTGMPLGVDSGQPGRLEARQVSTLTVPVYSYVPPCPWRISVFCYWNPPQPNTIRYRAANWLFRMRMPKLARKVRGEFKVIQVSGPQMEQRER